MTKAELITAMKDFPDDMQVNIMCDFEHRDPAGSYGIKSVYPWFGAYKCIYIEPEED